MSDFLRKEYEISLWEDIVTDNGLDEVCLARIGSNTMETPVRAFEPKLKQELNGTNTLTFSVYYRYYDEDEGEFRFNPFTNLLVNERKVKLKYDGKWYDFIVKEIREDSSKYTFTYTCKDLYINELSKNGYEIVLDNELMNNQGTIKELGDKILEGTDWSVGDVEPLQETIKEIVYLWTLPEDLTVTNMTTNLEEQFLAGTEVYVFSSTVTSEEEFVQFVYTKEGYFADKDGILVNVTNYKFKPEGLKISFETTDEMWFGKRLVSKHLSKYITNLDEFCYEFVKDGVEYYGYPKTEYASPTAIQNMLSNSTNFATTNGWSSKDTSLLITTISKEVNGTYRSVLNISEAGTLVNDGLYANRKNLRKYMAMPWYFAIQTTKKQVSGGQVTIQFADKEKDKTLEFTSVDGNLNTTKDLSGYQLFKFNFNSQLSYQDLLDADINIEINFASDDDIVDALMFPEMKDKDERIIVPDLSAAVEDIIKIKWFFFTKDQAEGARSTDDLIYTTVCYEDDTETIDSFEKKYSTDYEKIRSITAAKSNRFNLIQSLCESFECWAEFVIEHEKSGKIKLGEDGRPLKKINFKEYIGDNNEVGFRYGINLKSIQRTLKSDQLVTKLIVEPNINDLAENGICTIQSSVLNPSGETTIYNFEYYLRHKLLNREQVEKDLYSSNILENGEVIGLYPYLSEKNKALEPINIQISAINRVLDNLNSEYTANNLALNAAKEEKQEIEVELSKIVSSNSETDGANHYFYLIEYGENTSFETDLYYYKAGANTFVRITKDNAEYVKQVEGKSYLITGKSIYISNNYVDELQIKLATFEEKEIRFNKIEEDIKNRIRDEENLLYGTEEDIGLFKQQEILIEEKRVKLNKFFNKYSRYIQEGTWTSGDYIDPDLYYISAQEVSHTSAFPLVDYTISVIEISQIEGYSIYKFKIGDKTYVEDTEFFGWDAQGRPYKEEIVVSEVEYYLDDPSRNTIKVKNYKTQFEDLFQRITAATQTLQYAEGRYERAASAINPDGTINSSLLQDSLLNNSLVLKNAASNSVTWDETGITISNSQNPNEITRLVSSGIVLTTDGGRSWTTGITGNGINANVITTGRLDTNRIRIFNADRPTFNWDSKGISAYMQLNPESDNSEVDYNKFVRFNQFGLFGYTGYRPDEDLKDLQGVIDNSIFSLTWKGLHINIDSQDENVIRVGGTVLNPNFAVDGAGNVIANNITFNGELSGKLFSNGGAIIGPELGIGFGNTEINENTLAKNANFYVDEDGNVTMKGKIDLSNGSISWGGNKPSSRPSWAKSTYIDFSMVSSPKIIGNKIISNSGFWTSNEGYFGPANGEGESDDGSRVPTTGVAIGYGFSTQSEDTGGSEDDDPGSSGCAVITFETTDPYLIVTTHGVRMSNNGHHFYIDDSGIGIITTGFSGTLESYIIEKSGGGSGGSGGYAVFA